MVFLRQQNKVSRIAREKVSATATPRFQTEKTDQVEMGRLFRRHQIRREVLQRVSGCSGGSEHRSGPDESAQQRSRTEG